MGLISTARDLIRLPRTLRELRDTRRFLAERNASLRQQIASGVDRSFGTFQYDVNDDFNGNSKWSILDAMENDPHIKATLRDVELPLQNAEWEIEPASDDDRDIEIAEFVAANLLRHSGDRYGKDYWTQTSWSQRLSEILDMRRAGFAVFNKSMRQVGTKVVYDRIQWIEPATIDGIQPWVMDDFDNIVEVRRKYNVNDRFKYDEAIPVEQLALYPWEVKGARYEGRQAIRSLYGAWWRKDKIQRWALIWAQKAGAPVPLGHYPDDWEPQQVSAFEDFVKSTRGTSPAESMGMFPKTSKGEKGEVDYVGSDTGEVDRMRGLIDGENKEIGHGGATSSNLLGETDSGSRALGDSKQKKEFQMVEAVAKIICEFETHGVANVPGLIEELVDFNFAGVQAYPKLSVSKIDPSAGLCDVDKLIAAVGAGLVPKHEDLRRQVTERFGINLPDDAYVMEPEDDAPPTVSDPVPDESSSPPDDGSQLPPTEMRSAALANREEFRKRIAPLLEPMEGAPTGGKFRAPNKLEAAVLNLAEIQETFRVGERDIYSELRRIRGAMVSELFDRLRDGKITRRNLVGQRRSRFTGESESIASLRVVLSSIGRRGAVHVEAELTRS